MHYHEKLEKHKLEITNWRFFNVEVQNYFENYFSINTLLISHDSFCVDNRYFSFFCENAEKHFQAYVLLENIQYVIIFREDHELFDYKRNTCEIQLTIVITNFEMSHWQYFSR